MKLTTTRYVYARFDPQFEDSAYLVVSSWQLDEKNYMLLDSSVIEREVDPEQLRQAFVRGCEAKIVEVRAEAQSKITELTAQIQSVLALEAS